MHPDNCAPRLRIRAATRCLSVAAVLLALAACAGPTPLLKRGQSSGPQWPEAPFAARIEWVKSVATPEDAGIDKGFWKKALELLTGADLHPIVRPYGVLFDNAGRLLIADPGTGVVHLMDTKEGRYSRIVATNGAPLTSPIGLAEDDSNRLYITDSASNAVYLYDLDNHKLTPFLEKLQRPTGIAYNRANRLLYISETTAHRVIAVDVGGKVKYRFGDRPSDPSPLNLPTDIATDAKGQVYVTDPLNFKIKIFTPEGLLVSQFGLMGDSHGEFNKPKGVAVDAEGHIFVSESMLDSVQIFDDSGQFIFSFGTNGTDDGAFWMPSGLFINGSYIFVADTFNHRVQIFRYLGAEVDSKAMSNRMKTTSRLD